MDFITSIFLSILAFLVLSTIAFPTVLPPQNRTTTITSTTFSDEITGFVKNNCPFAVYVSAACWFPKCAAEQVTLQPGQQYWNPIKAVADMCSQTIKISKNPSMFPQYQVEYNIDLGGILWYNLSHEDGNPFGDVARYLEVDRSHCQYMYCAPNSDPRNCDWSDRLESCTPRDLGFYLC